MTGSVDVKQNNLPRVIPTINVEETTTVQKTTITDGYFDDIYAAIGNAAFYYSTGGHLQTASPSYLRNYLECILFFAGSNP